jgi:hypothetical protein
MGEGLGLILDRVYQWTLLLGEYGPKIVYIKGIHNTVADAVLRLEYDPMPGGDEIDDIEEACVDEDSSPPKNRQRLSC